MHPGSNTGGNYNTLNAHMEQKRKKKQSSFTRKSIVPPAKTQREFVT